jgi:hypothetical protein
MYAAAPAGTCAQSMLHLRSCQYSSYLTGTLPSEWGANAGVHRFANLDLRNNELRGEWWVTCSTQRSKWAAARAMLLPNCCQLDRNISGTLPESWAEIAYLSNNLGLAGNRLQGSIPSSWADADKNATYGPETPRLSRLDLQ